MENDKIARHHNHNRYGVFVMQPKHRSNIQSNCHEFFFIFFSPEMNIFPFRIYELHMLLYVMAHVTSECSVWFIWKTFKAMNETCCFLWWYFANQSIKTTTDHFATSKFCPLDVSFLLLFLWIVKKFIFNERLFFEMRCLKFSSDTFDCDCLHDFYSFSSQYSTKYIIIKTTWTATEEAFL